MTDRCRLCWHKTKFCTCSRARFHYPDAIETTATDTGRPDPANPANLGVLGPGPRP